MFAKKVDSVGDVNRHFVVFQGFAHSRQKLLAHFNDILRERTERSVVSRPTQREDQSNDLIDFTETDLFDMGMFQKFSENASVASAND
jgi:hypothetical protein